MADPTPVTFEQGYDQLKGIVERLDADDVSVHESCELFARGKGLEAELRRSLSEQKGKLDEIEAGEHLPKFRIVAPDSPVVEQSNLDTSDFGSQFTPRPSAPLQAPTDDDIPF